EDVLDVDAQEAREPQVLVDVEARIDDGGDPGVLVAYEVAGGAHGVMDQVTEDHRPTVRRRCVSPLGARLGPNLGLDLGRGGGAASAAGQLEGCAHEVAEQRLRAQRARPEMREGPRGHQETRGPAL